MKKQFTQSLLLATLLVGLVNSAKAAETALLLAGTWKFRLDAKDVGVAEKWYAQQFDDTVQLPGTTDENHKGIYKDEKCVDRLSRVWYWKGPAWYQRQVTIPDSWAGKKITLFFERSKNTRVWVDQTFCGWEDTLSAPQIFDVTKAMTPGKHTITVVVDNSKLPPVGPSHAVDERTQTNWNGIVGKMELRATAPVWLDDPGRGFWIRDTRHPEHGPGPHRLRVVWRDLVPVAFRVYSSPWIGVLLGAEA